MAHRCWVVLAVQGSARVQLVGKPEWSRDRTVREALSKVAPGGNGRGGWDNVRVKVHEGVWRPKPVDVRTSPAGKMGGCEGHVGDPDGAHGAEATQQASDDAQAGAMADRASEGLARGQGGTPPPDPRG